MPRSGEIQHLRRVEYLAREATWFATSRDDWRFVGRVKVLMNGKGGSKKGSIICGIIMTCSIEERCGSDSVPNIQS